MERELGISYPTVRSRLEALLRVIGLADGPAVPAAEAEPMSDEPMVATAGSETVQGADEDVAAQRRSILERLARHELSADDAAAAIRGLGKS
jgi:hypothetical protein